MKYLILLEINCQYTISKKTVFFFLNYHILYLLTLMDLYFFLNIVINMCFTIAINISIGNVIFSRLYQSSIYVHLFQQDCN